MLKVKYQGPAQIGERRMSQVDLGGDSNEGGTSDYFVWNKANDFTVDMPDDMFEILKTKAPGFIVVEGEVVDASIDDQASEPAAPKVSQKAPTSKGTPKEV